MQPDEHSGRSGRPGNLDLTGRLDHSGYSTQPSHMYADTNSEYDRSMRAQAAPHTAFAQQSYQNVPVQNAYYVYMPYGYTHQEVAAQHAGSSAHADPAYPHQPVAYAQQMYPQMYPQYHQQFMPYPHYEQVQNMHQTQQFGWTQAPGHAPHSLAAPHGLACDAHASADRARSAAQMHVPAANGALVGQPDDRHAKLYPPADHAPPSSHLHAAPIAARAGERPLSVSHGMYVRQDAHRSLPQPVGSGRARSSVVSFGSTSADTPPMSTNATPDRIQQAARTQQPPAATAASASRTSISPPFATNLAASVQKAATSETLSASVSQQHSNKPPKQIAASKHERAANAVADAHRHLAVASSSSSSSSTPILTIASGIGAAVVPSSSLSSLNRPAMAASLASAVLPPKKTVYEHASNIPKKRRSNETGVPPRKRKSFLSTLEKDVSKKADKYDSILTAKIPNHSRPEPQTDAVDPTASADKNHSESKAPKPPTLNQISVKSAIDPTSSAMLSSSSVSSSLSMQAARSDATSKSSASSSMPLKDQSAPKLSKPKPDIRNRRRKSATELSDTTPATKPPPSSQKDVQLYCICRKPYDKNKFMIQCDACDEWFHGTCIRLSQAKCDAIDKWYCAPCIEKGGYTVVWKPLCMKPGCSKVVGETDEDGGGKSKYCSDKCGVDVMRDVLKCHVWVKVPFVAARKRGWSVQMPTGISFVPKPVFLASMSSSTSLSSSSVSGSAKTTATVPVANDGSIVTNDSQERPASARSSSASSSTSSNSSPNKPTSSSQSMVSKQTLKPPTSTIHSITVDIPDEVLRESSNLIKRLTIDTIRSQTRPLSVQLAHITEQLRHAKLMVRALEARQMCIDDAVDRAYAFNREITDGLEKMAAVEPVTDDPDDTKTKTGSTKLKRTGSASNAMMNGSSSSFAQQGSANGGNVSYRDRTGGLANRICCFDARIVTEWCVDMDSGIQDVVALTTVVEKLKQNRNSASQNVVLVNPQQESPKKMADPAEHPSEQDEPKKQDEMDQSINNHKTDMQVDSAEPTATDDLSYYTTILDNPSSSRHFVPTMCVYRGRCPRHDGWEHTKPREIEMEITEILNKVNLLCRDRDAVVVRMKWVAGMIGGRDECREDAMQVEASVSVSSSGLNVLN